MEVEVVQGVAEAVVRQAVAAPEPEPAERPAALEVRRAARRDRQRRVQRAPAAPRRAVFRPVPATPAASIIRAAIRAASEMRREAGLHPVPIRWARPRRRVRAATPRRARSAIPRAVRGPQAAAVSEAAARIHPVQRPGPDDRPAETPRWMRRSAPSMRASRASAKAADWSRRLLIRRVWRGNNSSSKRRLSNADAANTRREKSVSSCPDRSRANAREHTA